MHRGINGPRDQLPMGPIPLEINASGTYARGINAPRMVEGSLTKALFALLVRCGS